MPPRCAARTRPRSLLGYYQQLGQYLDAGHAPAQYLDFCVTQFDCAVICDQALRERLRHEQQDEPRDSAGANRWQDRDASDAGQPMYGEL